MDQAAILRRYKFPCVMALPCADPRDASGLERGLREFAERSATPLILYLKDESNFGAIRWPDWMRSRRMVTDGTCVWIKYAVVRNEPKNDPYLQALLERVETSRVVSGIGERPAIVHMRDWSLPGFTTGSGCVAPAASLGVFRGVYESRLRNSRAYSASDFCLWKISATHGDLLEFFTPQRNWPVSRQLVRFRRFFRRSLSRKRTN